MFKAFSGALALALTLLVLNWFLPELVKAVVEVVLKILHLVSNIIDSLPDTPVQ
ncbi:MAG: hypothetical protein WC575_02655 [Patescibacteria group bacterium]